MAKHSSGAQDAIALSACTVLRRVLDVYASNCVGHHVRFPLNGQPFVSVTIHWTMRSFVLKRTLERRSDNSSPPAFGQCTNLRHFAQWRSSDYPGVHAQPSLHYRNQDKGLICRHCRIYASSHYRSDRPLRSLFYPLPTLTPPIRPTRLRVPVVDFERFALKSNVSPNVSS